MGLADFRGFAHGGLLSAVLVFHHSLYQDSTTSFHFLNTILFGSRFAIHAMVFVSELVEHHTQNTPTAAHVREVESLNIALNTFVQLTFTYSLYCKRNYMALVLVPVLTCA